MDLREAAAFVSGGAGGLGEATVRRLVTGGARVVIADLAADKGRALAAELGEATAFAECDVCSEESVTAALEQAAAMGPVRLSVAVHGGFGGGGRTLGRDGTPHALDDFRRTVEHYLVGTFNVLRLAAAAISRSEPVGPDGERGVVVNTASIAGYEATIGQVGYASAKGGVIGMTLTAARDLAPVGIRVVTIAPGVFQTPAYGSDPEKVEATWGPIVPFPNRMGKAEEYAALVEHICVNGYLNGEVIRADGALRFGPRGGR